ncbi:hypothetical protein Hanom_Chr14g01333081 [Helianthus anomalus]
MHHVVALIAERQGGTCTNQSVSIAECYVPYVQGLRQNYYRAGVYRKQPLYSYGVEIRFVYILPSSDPSPTLALLLVGFTEYTLALLADCRCQLKRSKMTTST